MARYTDPGHIPGPVFIPNCAAIRLIWVLANGKQAHNILHGSFATAPPVDTAWINSFGDAIKAALTSSGLGAKLANVTTLANVGYRDMTMVSPGVGHGEWVSGTASVVGTGGVNPLPCSISFVVSLKTGLSLQANRGRVYLPGFDESMNIAPAIADPTVLTTSVAFVTAIQTQMNSRGLTLCLAHPARQAYDGVSGATHPARSAGTVTVTNITALNNVWDSTRLRQIR